VGGHRSEHTAPVVVVQPDDEHPQCDRRLSRVVTPDLGRSVRHRSRLRRRPRCRVRSPNFPTGSRRSAQGPHRSPSTLPGWCCGCSFHPSRAAPVRVPCRIVGSDQIILRASSTTPTEAEGLLPVALACPSSRTTAIRTATRRRDRGSGRPCSRVVRTGDREPFGLRRPRVRGAILACGATDVPTDLSWTAVRCRHGGGP